MTRIEHAAVWVGDLEAARDFFVRWFGAAANDGYENPHTGFRSFFLRFDGGARLELMTKPGLSEGRRTEAETGLAHLAFSVGNRERVDALTARLQAEGCQLVSGPRTTGDGYYESCLLVFDGLRLEITV